MICGVVLYAPSTLFESCKFVQKVSTNLPLETVRLFDRLELLHFFHIWSFLAVGGFPTWASLLIIGTCSTLYTSIVNMFSKLLDI